MANYRWSAGEKLSAGCWPVRRSLQAPASARVGGPPAPPQPPAHRPGPQLTAPPHTLLALTDREGGGRRKRESLYDNAEPESLPRTSRLGQEGAAATAAAAPPPAAGQRRRRQQQQQQPPIDAAGDAVAWSAPNGGSSNGIVPNGSSSSSSGGGGGPSQAAGGWDEWGLDGADPSQQEDFGWAAESWAGSSQPSASSARQPPAGEQPQGPAAGGSSAGTWDPAAHHSYGGSRWGEHGGQPGAAAAGAAAGGGAAGADGWQGAGAGGQGAYAGHYSSTYEPGLAPPDISLLSKEELERVLPLTPSPQQAAYFSRNAVDNVQRWGAGLALTVRRGGAG